MLSSVKRSTFANTIVVYLDKIACDRSSGELISTCT